MSEKKRKFLDTSIAGRNEKMGLHLEECKRILLSRGHDYGYDNFIIASKIAQEVTGERVTPELVAACLLGIKLARYRELTANNKNPEGESLDDTLRDAVNYILLMDRERARQCKDTSATNTDEEDVSSDVARSLATDA